MVLQTWFANTTHTRHAAPTDSLGASHTTTITGRLGTREVRGFLLRLHRSMSNSTPLSCIAPDHRDTSLRTTLLLLLTFQTGALTLIPASGRRSFLPTSPPENHPPALRTRTLNSPGTHRDFCALISVQCCFFCHKGRSGTATVLHQKQRKIEGPRLDTDTLLFGTDFAPRLRACGHYYLLL